MAEEESIRLRQAYEAAIKAGDRAIFVEPSDRPEVRFSDIGVSCIRVCDRLGRLWLLPMEPNPSLVPDGWAGYPLELRLGIEMCGPLVVTGRA